MSRFDIATEVAAALAEAGVAVGSGPLTVTLRRRGAVNESTYPPTHGPDETFEFVGIIDDSPDAASADTGIRSGQVSLMLEAGATDIRIDDVVTVSGRDYSVTEVTPERPGGVVLMWYVKANGL